LPWEIVQCHPDSMTILNSFKEYFLPKIVVPQISLYYSVLGEFMSAFAE